MSCRENLKLLEAYVDGELELSGALALESHVEGCGRCREALARRRALRRALRGKLESEAAPARLRRSLVARFGVAPRPAAADARWSTAWAAPGIAAFLLAGWFAIFGAETFRPFREPEARVVFHVSSNNAPAAALRSVSNHLNATPGVRAVVVAHNEGIDLLLEGARDEFGQPLEPAITRLRERGVEFRVCSNTLERRSIAVERVSPAATVVPSGIAEIGRLQGREGYAYLRL